MVSSPGGRQSIVDEDDFAKCLSASQSEQPSGVVVNVDPCMDERVEDEENEELEESEELVAKSSLTMSTSCELT